MIVAAHGVPGMSVLELSYLLNSLGVTYGVVRGQHFDRVNGQEVTDVIPVIFDSVRTYQKTHVKFKSKKVSALILGDPITLNKEYGLDLVGAQIETSKVTFLPFSAQDLFTLLFETDTALGHLQHQQYDPVPAILKSLGSTPLASLQTALYRVKDTEVRAKVLAIIKVHFKSAETTSKLRSKLYKAGGLKVAEVFTKLVQTEDMKKLRLAVQRSKRSPDKVKTIAKKLKISQFDVKYLLAEKAK